MQEYSDEPEQHLFLAYDEDSQRNRSRSVGHARRIQTARRRRQQLESATNAAAFARGLVGWQTAPSASNTSSTSREITFRTQPHRSESGSVQQAVGEASTRRPAIQTAIDNGLRADPFSSFPSDNSREVMHIIDFYINTWSVYKRGAIDRVLGLNTQVDICWPIALQDNMLFDATLAVSRVAYCLGAHMPVNTDTFALRYKLQALSKLRQRMGQQHPPTNSMVFTITRMLSVSYLTCDNPAFQIHFTALSEVVRRYLAQDLDSSGSGNNINRLIVSRIQSWTPLFEYRQLETGSQQYLLQPGHEAPRITRIPSTVSDGLRRNISILPSGLTQLTQNGAFSMQTLSIIMRLHRIVNDMEDSSTDPTTITMHLISTIKDELVDLLASPDMVGFEQQVCYALLAFAIVLSTVYTIGGHSSSRSTDFPIITESPPLDRVAQAFLNLRFAGKLSSPVHSLCLQWCALSVGCSCFLVPDSTNAIRAKGHIILLSISEHLTPCLACNEWQPFERDLSTRFFWPDRMVRHWKDVYLATLHRQQQWESDGLLRLGVPANDKIEYMVLRDARGNLPTIEEWSMRDLDSSQS